MRQHGLAWEITTIGDLGDRTTTNRSRRFKNSLTGVAAIGGRDCREDHSLA